MSARRHAWLGASLLLGACYAGSSAPDADATASGRCAALELSADECARLGDVVLPTDLPRAHGNRFADDPHAARLGYELFFDLDALTAKSVRCSSCHAPEHGFATRFAMPTGLELVGRNAPALVDAARASPNFWDGRADSLWSQSLFTIENDVEMGGNRVAVVHRVAERYRGLYESAFGALPPIDDTARFPANGRPGSPEWSAMTEGDRALVTRAYVNVGKAFEAYLRRAAGGRAPVDRFFLGDDAALSASARAGARAFVRFGCRSCHSGPTFSDGRFHRLDLPLPASSPNRDKAAADRGRADGVKFLATSEFNALSPYYDREPGETVTLPDDLTTAEEGAFRTPSLRNVSVTAPYGHSGVFATLPEIVRFHLGGGGPLCHELTARPATDRDVDDLVAFLTALRGDDAPLPWSDWPGAGGDAGSYDAAAE